MFASLIIIISIALLQIGTSENILVRLKDGLLTGKEFQLRNGKIVASFLGVPYAHPPVGKYRFREPQPLKSWKGIWNATNVANPCAQYSHLTYTIFGEEDCLYLNIYTPKIDHTRLLDVVVYIHGGCFMFGDGSEMQPDFLLGNHDVVLVTINYRLGPFGFLSYGEGGVTGNNGLKDQVMALKWIQENIGLFGGNPNSVTISGMSAGGASVNYHYISPMSAGLFHRGISMSGSMFLPWTLSSGNIEKNSAKLAQLVGCDVIDPGNSRGINYHRKVVECLKKRPMKHIAQTVAEMQSWMYHPFSPFGPVVETNTNPSAVEYTPFLDKSPEELVGSGQMASVPWMVSTVLDEGLYPGTEIVSNENLVRDLDSRWNEIAPFLLQYDNVINEKTELDKLSSTIRDYYFGNGPITQQKLVKLLTDRIFTCYMEDAVKFSNERNLLTPIFYYKFHYRGAHSRTIYYARNNVNYGVSHGDDTGYILNGKRGQPLNLPPEDARMVKIMTSIWNTFMKNGRPKVDNIEWKPVSKTNVDFWFLNIDSPDSIELRNLTRSDDCNFWMKNLPIIKLETDVIKNNEMKIEL